MREGEREEARKGFNGARVNGREGKVEEVDGRALRVTRNEERVEENGMSTVEVKGQEIEQEKKSEGVMLRERKKSVKTVRKRSGRKGKEKIRMEGVKG